MTTIIRISNSNTGEIWERNVPEKHLVSFDLSQLAWDIIPFENFTEDAYDYLTDMAFDVGLKADKISTATPCEFGGTVAVQGLRPLQYITYRFEVERV